MRYNQPRLYFVGVETMRRIDLKGKTEVKYETIKELVDHGGNKDRAALALDCARRTIDRYIAGYKAEGKAFFVGGETNAPRNLHCAVSRTAVKYLGLTEFPFEPGKELLGDSSCSKHTP